MYYVILAEKAFSPSHFWVVNFNNYHNIHLLQILGSIVLITIEYFKCKQVKFSARSARETATSLKPYAAVILYII